MKIYTSYFAKEKELKSKGVICVSICAFPPKWFNGVNLIQVAPKNDILLDYKKDQDKDKYIRRYYFEVLKNLDVESFIKELERISQGKDIALCCYEKIGDFCHRHLLAKYLNIKGNYNITEYNSIIKENKNNKKLF